MRIELDINTVLELVSPKGSSGGLILSDAAQADLQDSIGDLTDHMLSILRELRRRGFSIPSTLYLDERI